MAGAIVDPLQALNESKQKLVWEHSEERRGALLVSCKVINRSVFERQSLIRSVKNPGGINHAPFIGRFSFL
jgi:hypothetical protein